MNQNHVEKISNYETTPGMAVEGGPRVLLGSSLTNVDGNISDYQNYCRIFLEFSRLQILWKRNVFISKFSFLCHCVKYQRCGFLLTLIIFSSYWKRRVRENTYSRIQHAVYRNVRIINQNENVFIGIGRQWLSSLLKNISRFT